MVVNRQLAEIKFLITKQEQLKQQCSLPKVEVKRNI